MPRWVWFGAFALIALRLSAADEARVLYPASHAAATTPAASGGGFGAITVAGALLLAGAGGWMLLRGRNGGLVRREARQLAIDETRSLGNRQFLVLASCHGKKFLLGVCPGRIELLAPIDAPGTAEKSA